MYLACVSYVLVLRISLLKHFTSVHPKDDDEGEARVPSYRAP